MPTADAPSIKALVGAPPPGIRVLAFLDAAGPGKRSRHLDLPVAIIGSAPGADIVVPAQAVAAAHAAIVNNGRAVLLVDLVCKGNLLCNGQPARHLQLLNDGDVVQVGNQQIVFQINDPKGSGPGDALHSDDPCRLRRPFSVVCVDDARRWQVVESVGVIGTRENAAIALTDPDIPVAHSLLFATTKGIGICHVGVGSPLKVNGRVTRSDYLKNQDRMLVGRFGLMIQLSDDRAPSRKCLNIGIDTHLPAELVRFNTRAESALTTLEARISELQQDIAQSWGQINDWRSELAVERNQLAVRMQDLDNKEKLLNRMADEIAERAEQLGRKQQELVQVEDDLNSQQAELKRSRMSFRQREAELEARCTELASLARELDSRQADIERFALEFEGRRQELDKLNNSIATERKFVEKERRSMEQEAHNLNARADEIHQREEALKAAEGQYHQEVSALQRDKQNFAEAQRKLEEREKNILQREQQFEQKTEELTRKSQSVEQRAALIERFRAFLDNDDNSSQGPADSQRQSE